MNLALARTRTMMLRMKIGWSQAAADSMAPPSPHPDLHRPRGRDPRPSPPETPETGTETGTRTRRGETREEELG